MRRSGSVALAVAVIALASIVFARTAVRALVYAPDAAPAVPLAQPEAPVSAASPERLSIPAIGVDASIERVGVNAAGNMRAPARFSEVSWYAPGTVPGARGSAVFAGHVDNGLGLAGVFKHLDELNVGDDIYVEAEDGTTKHFVVAGRASYPYDAVPNDILFNRADTARLNLITCGGTFLPLARTYDRRLVVFAVLASSSPPTGEVSGTSPIYEGTGEISEGGGRSRMRDPRHRRA